MRLLDPKEEARVEKRDGQVVGPYKAIFAGSTIIIADPKADVENGDTILRRLPNGKDERSVVADAKFFSQGVGSMGGFNAVLTGGFFAIAFGLFIWWISPQSYPLPKFVGFMAFIGIAFGLAMAADARYLARRFQLGNRDDYAIEAGEDAYAG